VRPPISIARITLCCLSALTAVLIVTASTVVKAEESVNSDRDSFSESTPVDDEALAEVHGTGLVTPSLVPRSDVAVILWDEQPKTKPAPAANTTIADTSQTARASVRVR
jgi:hypothetical protein